jgi:large subunit ribosomal protein L15
MNFLSNLPKITSKKQKRRGRGLGSGRGSKSGRGTTRHQKARESIPLHFEGGQGRMVKKYPLLRGKGKNKSRQKTPLAISLDRLNAFSEGDLVDYKSLEKKGLIEHKKNPSVKIVNGGALKKKLTIRLPISKTAKVAVEKLGGAVEE